MNSYHLEVVDNRPAGALRWLTLRAPELAGRVRPGQYLLVRCADPGSFDPLLRRPLFVAAAEEALGQIGLLYAPNERGLQWLARARPVDSIDTLGPFGTPFELDRLTRTLLLVGQGPGLAALLLLAMKANQRGCTVTLLAGAQAAELLPPPFLLPSEIEYESVVGDVLTLVGSAPPDPVVPLSKTAAKKLKQSGVTLSTLDAPVRHRIPWADQIAAALPLDDATRLRDLVRGAKLRWERGFAAVLLESPLVCGVGACDVCALPLRHGPRLLCTAGPVVDLRDV